MENLTNYATEKLTRITDHAYDRLKERNGWSRKTADRMVERVFTQGAHAHEIKGYLRPLIESKMIEAAEKDISDIILYGDVLYVFGRANTLVTMYPAPTRNSFQRKWDGIKNNANRRTKPYSARLLDGKVYGAAKKEKLEQLNEKRREKKAAMYQRNSAKCALDELAFTC